MQPDLAALGVEQDEIGERTADVEPDAITRAHQLMPFTRPIERTLDLAGGPKR